MSLAPSLNSPTPDESLAAFVPGGTVAAIVCKAWAASQQADSANSKVRSVAIDALKARTDITR